MDKKKIHIFSSLIHILTMRQLFLLLLLYLMYLIQHSWGLSRYMCKLIACITALIQFHIYQFIFMHVSFRYTNLKKQMIILKKNIFCLYEWL